MTGPGGGDAVGVCDPAGLETVGELDTPDTAVVGADADVAEGGTRCTAAACLTPKTAGGQSVCHPATTRAPPKRATATGTMTGALSDHRRLAPGVGSRVDGVVRAFGATGSGSRPWLPSVDSRWEEPWSEAPHSRQKCANSLFRCPHVGHRRSPANVNAPPQAVHKQNTLCPKRSAMADSANLARLRRGRADLTVWPPPAGQPPGRPLGPPTSRGTAWRDASRWAEADNAQGAERGPGEVDDGGDGG